VLSRIYSYGIEEGLLQNNPCRGIKAFTEKKRRRYAKEEELVSLGKILLAKMTTHPLQVAFVLLVALTGARPWSLFRLRRQDLYRRGNAGVLYFRGKSSEDSGEDESLILPEFLLELIEKLPVRDDGLLLGEVKYRAFWDLVRKKIGCNDLRLRDLRRTFGSMGLSDGVSLNLIGELLNHKSLQTTMNYAKLFDSVRVQASLRISNRIGLLLGVHE
jgi:integrase